MATLSFKRNGIYEPVLLWSPGKLSCLVFSLSLSGIIAILIFKKTKSVLHQGLLSLLKIKWSKYNNSILPKKKTKKKTCDAMPSHFFSSKIS